MMKPAALALTLVLCAVPVAAQDPLTTIPEAYRVQFENDWVKVVRVHYAAGVKLPVHSHPPGTTAYLYLNDSEGVVFRHESGSSRAVTRPPVKAGSLRVAAGSAETHNAENPSSTASDFLRVQFKTDAKGERNLRRRIPANTTAATEVLVREEYANTQMRITRLIVPPGQSLDLRAAATQPALVLALPGGQERWLAAGQQDRLANSGTSPLEFIRIDFLTGPVTPG